MRNRLIFALCMCVSVAAPAWAQQPWTAVLSAADSGTCAANNAGAVLQTMTSDSGVSVQVAGTFGGGTTLEFRASVDGANYALINLTPVAGSTAASSTTAVGVWQGTDVLLRAHLCLWHRIGQRDDSDEARAGRCRWWRRCDGQVSHPDSRRPVPIFLMQPFGNAFRAANWIQAKYGV